MSQQSAPGINPDQTLTVMTPQPPVAYTEETNDHLCRALFFRSMLQAEEYEQILELAEDPNLTEQFMELQRLLLPSFEQYMLCQTRLLAMNAESNWLIERLWAFGDIVSKQYHHFELERVMGTQILTLENGQSLDWHGDLGGGLFATRKLTLLACLSAPEEYTGGHFELLATTDSCARLDLGTVVIHPSFSVNRIHPVTGGRLRMLLSWLHGPSPFN